jgi:hypothetical protein
VDLLVVTAATVNGTTTNNIAITVQVDGAPASLDLNSVELPAAPRPLPITVTLTPPGADLFPVTGSFQYFGRGNLVPVDEGGRPPNFRPVRAAVLEDGSAVMSLIGYASRVRDVTAQCLGILRNGSDRRFSETLTTETGVLDAVTHVRTISDPLIQGGALSFDAATSIDPRASMLILEVAAQPAPKLLGVTFPRSLIPGITRGQVIAPPPVLLFFHSTAGQNFPDFYSGSYPFSWDFIHFGLLKYLFHLPNQEPLQFWGGKGMPYQMRVANAEAIYVLPLNQPFSEVGVMIDATSTQQILEEVTAFLCRKNSVFIEPGLGRVALGGFSSGNLLVTRFLQKNAGTPFSDNVLKEVYNFDIPASQMSPWAQAAGSWLKSGASSDKMLRVYTQQDHPIEFQQFVGAPTPAPPFVVLDSTSRRTVACIPAPTWFPLAGGQMQSQFDFQVVHQLIAETCLTDAMRRSGFVKPP